MADVGSGDIDLANLIRWLLWLGDMDVGINSLRINLFVTWVLVGKGIWVVLEESALDIFVCIIILSKLDYFLKICREDSAFGIVLSYGWFYRNHWFVP